MRNLLILLFIIYSFSANGQECLSYFNEEYDKFEKVHTGEFERIITLSTFQGSDGETYIGNHIGFSWKQNYNNDSDANEGKGWRELKYQGIELNIWSKIQIEDCLTYKCWQFSDTHTKFNGYDYNDWNEYLLGNKSYLAGYSYVIFLSTSGGSKKIYIEYDDIGTNLILNDVRYPITIANYRWLISNDIESVRFHNAKSNKNLDVDIPNDNKSVFKEVINCIGVYKIMIEDHYNDR